MLRVESNTKLEGFTEFEEDILFDQDDPDFHQDVAALSTILTVGRNVPLYPPEIHSNYSSLTALNRDSFSESEPGEWPFFQQEHVLSIEELRLQMSSCFTCGVSWSASHISLDCAECGGYALERPCPQCEGACGAIWKRDLTLTHASNKARWEGECKQKKNVQNGDGMMSEISQRLEKLETVDS